MTTLEQETEVLKEFKEESNHYCYACGRTRKVEKSYFNKDNDLVVEYAFCGHRRVYLCNEKERD